MKHLSFFYMLWGIMAAEAQTGSLSGMVRIEGSPIEFINVLVEGTSLGATTSGEGRFIINAIPAGKHQLKTSGIGYQSKTVEIIIKSGETTRVSIDLLEDISQLQEVVITGTMREVTKMNSPIPIEVYLTCFLQEKSYPQYIRSTIHGEWRAATNQLQRVQHRRHTHQWTGRSLYHDIN